MKANEAPERIWMDLEWIPHFDCKDCITEDSVEYIRADAFIEKVCKFLSEKCDLCNYEEFDPENRTYYINHDKIVEDFKNYMKGE